VKKNVNVESVSSHNFNNLGESNYLFCHS